MGHGALSKPAVQWWLSLNSSTFLSSLFTARLTVNPFRVWCIGISRIGSPCCASNS